MYPHNVELLLLSGALVVIDAVVNKLISVRDFDTMQIVIRALRPEESFTGAKDPHSGTTWITEMYQETEGHPDVVRYLWLKKYTSSKVWNEVTANITPLARCYRDYERQLEKVVRHLRKSFDTDEHLHKTEHIFSNVNQGKGSVYDFVERLEELSGELYHLGSPILEYKLKWNLYNGLNDSELQLRVNDVLDDKDVNYADFKATVLRQYRRMTNSFGFKSKRDATGSPRRILGHANPVGLPVPQSTHYSPKLMAIRLMMKTNVDITSIWDEI
ncbi:hypothetical protein FOL47_009181 [Perkinsus chesapeaki]|uniref:Retrotransposon gag domain-containing protein n=1 Tax=Perkinsus chesapeaki TaxID=330153 RepID=A0A7J6LA08_PERCH|nr:hypothetical protein FOL47_009181 [Perkinsus chesapeaki]